MCGRFLPFELVFVVRVLVIVDSFMTSLRHSLAIKTVLQSLESALLFAYQICVLQVGGVANKIEFKVTIDYQIWLLRSLKLNQVEIRKSHDMSLSNNFVH